MPEIWTDREHRLRRTITGILIVIALGGAIDLILDRPATIWSFHVLFELAFLAFSLGAAAYLWIGWRRADVSLERTQQELQVHIVERDAWRGRAEKLLLGLGEEIDRQLREWRLTPAERETALLVLKGFGHKEIAAIQEKSERTVRQHAIAVYRKAGVSGRAEFSAFFLEDLLLPHDANSAEEIKSAPL